MRFMLDILIILLDIGFCCGFDISDFHDYCGKTITNSAGELDFDEEKLPSHLPEDTCSVIIKLPTTFFSSRTRALFYFTKFDLSKICKDGNVTILDGTPDRGVPIKGLPLFICGQDKTLVNSDSVFTTKGGMLTVTFKRGDNVTAFHGKFNIKYATFSTGACDAQGVHRCLNGRCIPKWYSCSTYIDACGESQTDCTMDTYVTTRSPSKTNSTSGFFLFMVLCSAFLLLFICCGTLAKGQCPSLKTFRNRPRRRFQGNRQIRRSSFAAAPSLPSETLQSPTANDESNIRLYSGGTADSNSNGSPSIRNSFSESGNDDSEEGYNDISLRDVDITSSNAHLPDTSVDLPPSYDDIRPPPPRYDDVHPPPSYDTVAPPPSYDNASENRLQIQLYRR